mmetsp:Transcript_11156/g.21211  ORF Transcript_11156/g.21211 Transcript_11156/m.21211 type:complete len:667 (-) Transcript_11156:968-2968(-)
MDNYEIAKPIGRGNFGVVNLVRSRKDDKTFVMKVIDLNELSKSEREGALQEVKLLARLRHPFIVSYRESFLAKNNNLHIVMNYCEGGDLNTRIRNAGGEYFSEEQVLDWFVQIALALQYCHQKKIIHRDLKSQNVFLTKKENIRLGDFGIARVLNGTNELAMSVVGTPYSMSPEVCENKPYSYSSDIWALGCVLYEMCVLKHAFDAKNLLGLVWKIVQEKYPPIPDIYSDDLRNLISAMLSKDPNKRPTIDDILDLDFIDSRLQAQVQKRTANLHQKKTTVKPAGIPPSAADITGTHDRDRDTDSRDRHHDPQRQRHDRDRDSRGRDREREQEQSPEDDLEAKDFDLLSPRERVILAKRRKREAEIKQRKEDLKKASAGVAHSRSSAKQMARDQLQISTPSNKAKAKVKQPFEEAEGYHGMRSQTAQARYSGDANSPSERKEVDPRPRHQSAGGPGNRLKKPPRVDTSMSSTTLGGSVDEVEEDIIEDHVENYQQLDERPIKASGQYNFQDEMERPIKASGQYVIDEETLARSPGGLLDSQRAGGKEERLVDEITEEHEEYEDDFEDYQDKNEDEDKAVYLVMRQAARNPKRTRNLNGKVNGVSSERKEGSRKRPVVKRGSRITTPHTPLTNSMQGPSIKQKYDVVKSKCLKTMSENDFDGVYAFF